MLKQVTNNSKMKRFTSRISVPTVVCEDATMCYDWNCDDWIFYILLEYCIKSSL